MPFIASLGLLAENTLRKTLLILLALSPNKLKTKTFPHHRLPERIVNYRPISRFQQYR
jgi:hypothetical protein